MRAGDYPSCALRIKDAGADGTYRCHLWKFYKDFLVFFSSNDSHLAYMRRTSVAFLGLAFVIYWLWTVDAPTNDQLASLNPVLPSLIRMLPFPSKSQLHAPTAPNPGGRSTYDPSGLRRWLTDEVVRVGRVDANPSSAVLRLKRKALTFNAAQVELLKDVALDQTSGGDERFLAVYMIGLSESAKARESLVRIGQTPIPSTANERAYADEVVIRAHAMEGAIKHMNPSDSVKFLQEILTNTKDPSLEKHARYWLARLG